MVERHNQLVERTYHLEQGLAVARNDIESLKGKVAWHERVSDGQRVAVEAGAETMPRPRAIQAVDLTFDALINEIDVSKMRVFLSDVLFDREQDGNKSITIPFGKQDCTVFRKVMSTEDTIQEFAPALRANAQIEAFRVALKMLGDLTGFGINYFDMDDLRGYVKTATEVSSDNSALMRNIRRHENSLEGSIVSIARAVMHVSRGSGESIPNEGITTIQFDDSIIQDTAAEKAQDMAEVSVTLNPWEYRMRWLGEDEQTARARAAEIGAGSIGNASDR